MTDEQQKAEGRKEKRPFSRETAIKVIVTLAAVGLIYLMYTVVDNGLPDGISSGKNVEFTQLAADKIPQSIEKDVIPEYRELERALGCLLNGEVYVVVTRGEKPTAAFDLTIDEMRLVKTDNGTKLAVTAIFTDPPEGKAVAQVITYPYKVAKTELTVLPDTIELITKFA